MAKPARILAVLLVVAAAAYVRWSAARELPPDHDELIYIPAGFRFAERMTPGRWAEIPEVATTANPEHPPLVKILFGLALRESHASEPDWERIRMGRPTPPEAGPAFQAPRRVSAVGGVLQVALTSLASPLGGLWLAFDTYHVKFVSQAYLEGVAGLFALLAVLLFERSVRRREPRGLLPEVPDPSLGPLLGSAAALALAAASKYTFGLVVGLSILPFLVLYTRNRPSLRWAFLAVGLVVFAAADPALWRSPFGILWRSVTFHLRFALTEHGQPMALPWWQPLYWLTHDAPGQWHPGVFPVGFPDRLILVGGLLGVPAAVTRRPVFAAWVAVGLVFLLAWPTKWPQYTLLVRPALAVCAGLGLSALWQVLAHLPRRPRAGGLDLR